MSNPVWTQKTWVDYGWKSNPKKQRFYHYHFEDQWFHFLTRYKATIVLPFKTIEEAVNGISEGHQNVLANPDFTVRGINVVEWIRDCVTTGKADFVFLVDAGPPNGGIRTSYTLTARFSDKAMATMFKLAFGGK